MVSSSSLKSLGSPRSPKKMKVDDNHEGTTTAPPNWLELSRDMTAKILCKVGAFEMMSAEHVYSTWQSI